ncbi:hypothetical protein M5X00_26485 [Paenibacillus alvei]|uniref:hypothetical protein n=1 Tax=Paenibacillus alvei TaxID=44250 RepID=UPI000288DC8C|nr:hypothetical protein [Paenibacillus alvei]EJW14044.1 hypothetical protein PAV_141p01500 [Paenibacillus alvei DSM 29]MCY9544900.1 hypothetical protein [Paenibacillus alvei]MCY9707801.1 hypothetical protein [Paenibacillus alvei]MCY9757781.1 hypothetical protein [Paenibacillus alvei]MEC0082686.1 hypothetical protein [Paenibacillus alvei]
MTKKISRKEKWRNQSLNPSNIDEYLTDLIEDTKGQYITQGVSFNKDDSYQIGLLKQALLQHSTFSGLVKHLLTQYFSGQQAQQMMVNPNFVPMPFSHTREIQQHESAPIAQQQQQEQVATEKQAIPVVKQENNKPQAPRQPQQKKQEGQGGRKRVTPSRPAGGGLLAPNPNAKLPSDPSAN